MALRNKKGELHSFESNQMIKELKSDIAEFGTEQVFAVWLKYYEEFQLEFVTNYDFIVGEKKITKDEVRENERIVFMSADKLLQMLEEQN